MIARYCTVRTVRSLEPEPGVVATSALFAADGLEGFLPLTAEEAAWLRRVRAAGTPLVLTISEEAST